MAFVTEYISEEDKKKYNLPFEKSWMWTIDRERNVFMSSLGMDRENYSTFELYFEGSWIEAVALERGGTNEKGKNFVSWLIVSMGIPPELQHKKKLFMDLFKEAMEEYGYSFNYRGYYKSVEITFSEKLTKDIS